VEGSAPLIPACVWKAGRRAWRQGRAAAAREQSGGYDRCRPQPAPEAHPGAAVITARAAPPASTARRSLHMRAHTSAPARQSGALRRERLPDLHVAGAEAGMARRRTQQCLTKR
jgi:hypothetical protein